MSPLLPRVCIVRWLRWWEHFADGFGVLLGLVTFDKLMGHALPGIPVACAALESIGLAVDVPTDHDLHVLKVLAQGIDVLIKEGFEFGVGPFFTQ